MLSLLFIGLSTVIGKYLWKRHGCEILYYLDFDTFEIWDVGEMNEGNVITTGWVRDDSKVEKCAACSSFVSLVKWFNIGWPLPACSQRSGSKHYHSVLSAFIATFRYNHLSSIYLFRIARPGMKVDPHTCHLQFPIQEFKCVSAGANSQHGIHGPVFLLEPPPVLRFSNATGSQVSCSAHGSPPPDVTWLHHDGSVVTAVPGFRWVHILIIWKILCR
jgi:hypothetical protein